MPTDRQRLVVFAALLAASAALAAAAQSQNPPTFRAAADLIAVDVQVVNNKGVPILGLGADKFEVAINGRSRRVVSAELIRFDAPRPGGTSATTVASGGGVVQTASLPGSSATRAGRLIMLAVDTKSFDQATSKGMLTAAKEFLERLQPADQIGLFAYPIGPQFDPTTNHAAILSALETVVGQREKPPANKYNLRASEMVSLSKMPNLTALDAGDVSRVPEIQSMATKICPPNGEDNQGECMRKLAAEVRSTSVYLESEASQSLGMIRSLLSNLALIAGRKTLVLLSGGMILSDQVGGRPDIGNFGVVLGQEAALANTAIYTLFVDWKYLDQFAASSGRAPNTLANLARDSSINSHWLDTFSGTAGGKLFTVTAGNGQFAFDRILSETSAYYLLGVEPDDSDRDGKPRLLSVRVKQSGVTIRARTWVAIPKPGAAQMIASATPVPANVPTTAPPPPIAAAASPASSPTSTPAGATTASNVGPAPAAPSVAAAATPARPTPTPAPRAAAPVATVAAPPVIDPRLQERLVSAGGYVTRFDAAFSNVVAEERYVQTVTSTASGLAPQRRELVSDFLIVTLPGTVGWVPFRDVLVANGSPVRARDDRLIKMFARQDSTTMSRANELLQESATYNIGIKRTINLPILALEVLRPEMQTRFRFSNGTIDRSSGPPVYVIDFAEVGHPTLISGEGGRDLLTRGEIRIDAATGVVLRTELSIDDAGVSVSVTTRYQYERTFGVAVPIEMREEYVERNGAVTQGVATYARFRRFDVSVSDRVGP